jgi:hypothetical protein
MPAPLPEEFAAEDVVTESTGEGSTGFRSYRIAKAGKRWSRYALREWPV